MCVQEQYSEWCGEWCGGGSHCRDGEDGGDSDVNVIMSARLREKMHTNQFHQCTSPQIKLPRAASGLHHMRTPYKLQHTQDTLRTETHTQTLTSKYHTHKHIHTHAHTRARMHLHAHTRHTQVMLAVVDGGDGGHCDDGDDDGVLMVINGDNDDNGDGDICA